MTTFQRAHSVEQREIRRRSILDAASAMLREMPVSQVTLNELSRRAGLAKSNVLRYFESREAVLLELGTIEANRWLADVDQRLSATIDADAGVARRADELVTVIVTSLGEYPVLCDLISTQAAVLERNVSAEIAVTYKLAGVTHVRSFGLLVSRTVPELSEQDAMWFAAMAVLQTGAFWTHSHPTAEVIAVYETNPEIARYRMDFARDLRTMLSVILAGLLAPTG